MPAPRRAARPGRLAGGDRGGLRAEGEVERAHVCAGALERSGSRSGVTSSRSIEIRPRIPGQNIWWAALHHRHVHLVGLDPEGSESRGDELGCAVRGLHSGWQPYRAGLAGIVQRSGRRRIRPPLTAESGPQPGNHPVLPGDMLAARRTRQGRTRAPAAAVAACLLAALVAAAWPGAADSAPPRVVVLGQTSTTPRASCPGKIVNNVEVVPCRVEGHVTGFQAMADGVAQPYEAPFDGKIVAWSITLAKPSTIDTATTTDEVGFFNDFLGQPSQARIGVLRPVRDSKPPSTRWSARARSRCSTPTSAAPSSSPSTTRSPSSAARSSPSPFPPGRRCSPSTSRPTTPGAAAACRHCSSKADIQGGHPQQGVGKIKTYGCYYSNARLLYTATLVKQP